MALHCHMRFLSPLEVLAAIVQAKWAANKRQCMMFSMRNRDGEGRKLDRRPVRRTANSIANPY